MTDFIVYIDRSTVRDGKVSELEGGMGEVVNFVETNEQEILACVFYFSADRDRMTVMHMHLNRASLEFQREVAGPESPRLESSSTSNPSTGMAT